MKRMLLVVGVLAIFFAGCGGSGGGALPLIHDLTSIQGIWDFTLTHHIDIIINGEKIHIDDTQVGYFNIEPNSVTNQDGDAYTWTYNGVVLEIREGVKITEQDPDCGNMILTGTRTLEMPMTSVTKSTTITGDMAGNIYSDYCGGGTFTVTYNGNLTKR